LKIHNIRKGFACNSSSVHSIIFYEDDSLHDDYEGFGWDEFILVSEEAKLHYFFSMLANQYDRYNTDLFDVDKETLKKLQDKYVDGRDFVMYNTDHSSRITFPKRHNSRQFHEGFIKAVRDAFLQEDLIVIGGNSNGTSVEDTFRENGIPDYVPHSKLERLQENDFDYVRYDESGYWCLYSRYNGDKVRFTFDEDTEVTKAATPELVDLKITNRCKNGCKFCYMDSNDEGAHAELEVVKNIVDALSKLEVFEIALGGGDVLTHPHFEEIVRHCHYRGITPNITIRDFDWLRDDRRIAFLKKFIGGVAVSAGEHLEATLVGLNPIIQYHDLRSENKISVQVIDGVVRDFNQASQNSLANTTLTVLGYKNTGRGKQFNPYVKPETITLRDLQAAHVNSKSRIGVDTAYIANHKKEFDELEIPSEFYTEEEGKFSMFIDAVRSECAMSSYQGEKTTLKNVWFGEEDLAQEIKEIFKGY